MTLLRLLRSIYILKNPCPGEDSHSRESPPPPPFPLLLEPLSPMGISKRARFQDVYSF